LFLFDQSLATGAGAAGKLADVNYVMLQPSGGLFVVRALRQLRPLATHEHPLIRLGPVHVHASAGAAV
jgi:hypothetical protein